MNLEELKKIYHKWLHIGDTDVLDVLMASAISQKIDGDPLWLFLIAPSGGCKTELLRILEGKDFYHLSNLTSKTFISGLTLNEGKEGKGKTRKVEDLLPQLDNKVLVMKDFTVILEKRAEERNEILGQMRDVYDGTYSMKFGSMDKKVEYPGITFGFLGGVTPVIDKYFKVMQVMGERFLKYRLTDDMDSTTKKAYGNQGQEKVMRKELQEATTQFLSQFTGQKPNIQFSDQQYKQELLNLAQFVAICRTPCPIQDNRTDFYFDFEPTPERPTRLVKQLKKLAKCLAAIHGKTQVERQEMDLVKKVAFHTCPPERMKILGLIEKSNYAVKRSYIRQSMKLPESSVNRILDQLIMLELIESEHKSRETKNGKEQYYEYWLAELPKKVLCGCGGELTKGGEGSYPPNTQKDNPWNGKEEIVE